MGLMKQAYDTYCTFEKRYAGRYFEESREPLAPVSHQIVRADIEITLDPEGALVSARLREKAEPPVIVPVTERSAGRTGTTAGSSPHPLCDQIRFFSPEYPEEYAAYLAQLHEWETSHHGHPKLRAVARYVEKGTILEDLRRLGLIALNDKGLPVKEKQFVCWCVESGREDDVPECWKDRSLFRAFIDYYEAQEKRDQVYCMVTGERTVSAVQHPKKILNEYANAKLISANDTGGFTYRGRFTDDRQALTVGYAASQKAHSALRWLAANQGVSIGKRTFLCWSPQGVALPGPTSPMLRPAEALRKPSDYKRALRDALQGWAAALPDKASAVIAAFDAATSGRLSLTYYSELQASDFLMRLYAWDSSCQWWNGPFGVQSPSLYQIVSCAFGTPQTEKGQTRLKADDRVLGQQIQRLVSCRVDSGRVPPDIPRALAERASNLQLLEPGLRESLLFTACAVIKKYHFDRNGEEWNMALEPDKRDISYQYGRLLAVLEKIERDTYDREENREPNAMRMQPVYARRPQYAGRIIWEQLKKAYYPRLRPAARAFYDRLIGEIAEQISAFPAAEQNRPLGDTYLLGYYLQRSELYRPRTEEKKTEE